MAVLGFQAVLWGVAVGPVQVAQLPAAGLMAGWAAAMPVVLVAALLGDVAE